MGQSRGNSRAQHERLQAQYQRQIEQQAARDQKVLDAADKAAAKAARDAHIADQVARAQRETDEVDARVAELGSLLSRGLARSARIDMSRRRRHLVVPPLVLGALAEPAPPPRWESYAPPEPGLLGRAFGGEARFAQRRAAAREAFATATAEHARAEEEREAALLSARRRDAEAVARQEAEVATANARLEEWITAFAARTRGAVEGYLAEVLGAVPLPADFPRHAEVTFGADDEHAVIRFELPGKSVVPGFRSVSYVRTRDELIRKERPARECASLYRSVVSQSTLLVLRDVFDADAALRKVSVNGHVSTTNRATGQPAYPCLISVIVDREEFEGLVLDNVGADECLRHLKALVSEHPYAVEAVRPLIDFDRTRYAFAESVDVVAELDHRDDLMTLTPTEFEHLVRQLFEATPGMQGWTTRPSKDDGVDAVIFNDTPITGGLTVVQAKQYSNTIGVHHVRELAGTMEDKKAGRGVLVTTSSFTKDARLLSNRLGRIQLIDGGELVYLLKQTLDKDVVIGRRTRRP
jgi:restriction system protein